MKKTAVILFNLGGPDKLSAVKPFLFNLFYDKAIINLPNPLRYFLAKFIAAKRNIKASEIYIKLGGKSPILEITNSQAEALEKELSFSGNFKVFTCMRYWHPMSYLVAKKVMEYGADEIILLPLYPQFSTSTTKSSFLDFENEIRKFNANIKIKKVCCYPTNHKFILAHSFLLQKTIEEVELSHKKKKFRLLFSAHGLPQKLIDNGDPYVFQITKSTEAIIAELKKMARFKKHQIDYKICYQSKVGSLKWTSPSLDEEMERAAQDKIGVIIIPIAFVSDHSETLVELDVDFRKVAQEKNLPFYYRVKALNNNGYFIESLVEICKNVSQKNQFCSNDLGSRICPKELNKCIS